MARKFSIAALVLLVFVAGLLIAGQWSLHRHSEEFCNICARHINPKAGVIAEIGTRRQRVCCAHCAVTEGLQEHKLVRLIEVTDYGTGRKLDPRQAWYVDGSRINACAHDMTHLNEMKQVEKTAFDRCSPGTFAFASRGDADTFAAKNGGTVLAMNEMLAGVNAGEAKP
ncbi:MAG: nitrous oxide reductase accessory protein NosL [Acidobacteriia bacterium]|nr:nitrous oxide reductase accessory protein NosL [Terriglobia bacterium]